MHDRAPASSRAERGNDEGGCEEGTRGRGKNRGVSRGSLALDRDEGELLRGLSGHGGHGMPGTQLCARARGEDDNGAAVGLG